MNGGENSSGDQKKDILNYFRSRYEEGKTKEGLIRKYKNLVEQDGISKIKERLKNSNWKVREAAKEVFLEKVTPEDIPFIMEMLKEDRSLRIAALEAFRELQSHEHLPLIKEILKDPEEDVKNKAADVFPDLVTPEDIPEIKEMLKDPDRIVRIAALEAFKKLQGHEHLPLIKEILKDPDEYVRNKAVIVFSELVTYEDIPEIKEMLKDLDGNVRMAAVASLARLVAFEHIPAIKEMLEDIDENVRNVAEEVRGIINEKMKGEQISSGKIHIHNLTGKRIGIAPKAGNIFKSHDEKFVISPFDKKTVTSEQMDRFEFHDWEKLDLIEVEHERKKVTESLEDVLSPLFTLIFLIIVFSPAFKEDFATPYFWVYIALIIIIIIVSFVLYKVKEFRDKFYVFLRLFKEWSAFGIILLLILAVGIGLPAFVIYYFGGVKETLPDTSFHLLGRGLQLVFIAIASLLPALMYFLFTQRQLRVMQENFYRQVVRFDPRVVSLKDAKSLYKDKVEAIYGPLESKSRKLFYGARSPVFLATFILTIGWIFTLRPFGVVEDADNLYSYLSPDKTPLAFGFIGAYFFGLNMLFSRYARSDIRPKAYSHIIVRIFSVIILIWVLSELPWTRGSEWLLIFAFVAGIVPETAISLINEYLRSFGLYRFVGISKEDSLKDLEGINLYNRAQLHEEGIENIENLAHHELIDLLLHTRIPVPSLLDWVDQAILHLHLGKNGFPQMEKESWWDLSRLFNSVKKDKEIISGMQNVENKTTSKSMLESLHEHGIRTATDLEKAYEEARCRDKSDDLLKKLEGAKDGIQQDTEKLRVVLDTFKNDEWMAYLRHWKDPLHLTNRIFNLHEMKDLLSGKCLPDCIDPQETS